MRRKLVLKKILTFLFILTLLTGCGSITYDSLENPDTPKLKVIATIFPQYDFVRQIAKNKVELSMLLPPGAESHTFEPSPSDILNVTNSDLFIYTGAAMEPWAKRIISSIPSNKNAEVMDISEKIPYDETPEEHEAHDINHYHTIDPHFFTNPVYAQIAVKEICEALCRLDPKNAHFYRENTSWYLGWLSDLDKDIRDVAKKKTRDEVVFGGRFAFYHFMKEYDIKYISAFDGCSAETDPGIMRIYEIITEMQEKEIRTVYYEELRDPATARFIAEETGAELLLLHSCHNITKDEMKIGVGYLDLMKKNLVNLERGLNRWE